MKNIILFFLIITVTSCSNAEKKYPDIENSVVRIETSYGNIDIMLYNETPLHRDNFLGLIEDGFYDDLLFHRVIENFMIQGGDPNSKGAEKDSPLGSGGPGYTISAEIHDHLFHKKGALAAARLGDNVNPEKNSSGSQFYIVHGTLFSDHELDEMEAKINYTEKQEFAAQIFSEFEQEYLLRDEEPDYAEITERIRKVAEEHFAEGNLFSFSPEQREVYRTNGGAPHLDRGYTVFGQTLDGFDVIDKIASTETNRAARPVNDIRMKLKILQ